MNYTAITLGCFFLLIAYFIYTFYFMSKLLVNQPINLNVSSPLEYAVKLMQNPASKRYYYECWLNIDTNEPISETHAIFYRGNGQSNSGILPNNFVLTLTGSSLDLYINNGSVDSNGIFTPLIIGDVSIPGYNITTTFPFQKWTQVVVSVDGPMVDTYLDGKLINTYQINNGPNSSMYVPDNTTSIKAGNAFTYGQMKLFTYYPDAINPQAVWNKYASATSFSGLTQYFGAYNVDMSLLRNNTSVYEISLF